MSTHSDTLNNLTELKETHQKVVAQLDLEEKQKQLNKLEADSVADDFWQHEETARNTMQEISSLRDEITQIKEIGEQIDQLIELAGLAGDEKDSKTIDQEISIQVSKLKKQFEILENKLFLSGAHDQGAALISIHAGQGGTEAMDWVSMLMRMYLKYFERQGWKAEILSESLGEEAGVKEVSFLVEGKYAYGYLKHESGTHRLVRLSPFNADNLRQTSFAMVEVLPQVKEVGEQTLNEAELEWEFFRSSGKGGQNVNKVSTAVRVKHIPSGIIVECQAQRTQVQNRKLARSLLASKLWEKKLQEQAQKLDIIKGEYHPASWGTQIRNYVLHPYQMVKDTRTGVETSNTEAVLGGDIDIFIQSGIRQLS